MITANSHGDLVVAVVALCDIEANTELTINYGHRDDDEITPNTHPTVCNCGAFAAQKNHYMELGGLPLNLKEDACDRVDWNVFLTSVPATRMTGYAKAIENKNVEGVVVGYLDKLFPNRHSGDHRKGPRARYVNHKSCMTHRLCLMIINL